MVCFSAFPDATIVLGSHETLRGKEMSATGVTPMMAQYLEIKDAHPGSILFYRMGDFYEMFFEDAVSAAEALDIALTKRGQHQGQDIPMCGVPVHAAEGYLLTLIRKGFRVAVCEQLESPAEAKKRGSKSVVKRDVVRLVTPGTLTEDSLLEARQHNFLAAYAEVRGEGALAWVDISTGAFSVMMCPRVRLGPELARLSPREALLVDGSESEVIAMVEDAGAALTELGRASFDSSGGLTRLCALFGVATLDSFGSFERVEISAMAAIAEYLDITQKGHRPLLRPPMKERKQASMLIDAATRRSLELTQALGGGRKGSLLATIDRTVSAAGGRLLERRLSAPSRDLNVIQARQANVAVFKDDTRLLDVLRSDLRAVHDIDRALSRLALDRGGPRDLSAIRNSLKQAAHIDRHFDGLDLPEMLHKARTDLRGHDAIGALLDDALVAEPPLLTRDGGFVAPGFDDALDEARNLRDEGRGIIGKMQGTFVELTGIQSLKIKHNNVLGYFVETTATHADKMLQPPLNETFIHRQTTANQVRFTTVELSNLETRILNAGSEALEIEKRVFAQLRAAVLEAASQLSALARALAEFDLSAALARMAIDAAWVAPKMTQDRDFDVKGGRHPVVEAALRHSGNSFVANDCDLSEESIWLLTGPNMAGKSTFLRQNALIVVLAQMGSFVPAQSATIGVVSQIFSRVGASDDLASGRSTFMVEMIETAAILNQADERALVILDEIGRGTATYDGLSIAWATLEHLHDENRCRAIFATHYHEMSSLADRLDHAANATVAVKEWGGDVVFLHEVRRGTADRSYGVQVARLAGLPDSVVARARVVLDALESSNRDGQATPKALIDDLPLFSAVPTQQNPVPEKANPICERLETVFPDALSPRDALGILYELKEILADSSAKKP